MGTLFSPLDNELQIPAHQQLTPRMHECAVRLGCQETFGQAAKDMLFHHGLRITKENVRRHTEAVGKIYAEIQTAQESELPKAERCDRHMVCADAAKVRTTDKDSSWRDIKTLTVAELLANGRTKANSYFSRMEGHLEFTKHAQSEVQRRQLAKTRAVVAVHDGGDWIPDLVTACRADSVRILDFYHAAEHLAHVARTVFGEGTDPFNQWFEKQRHELRYGNPDLVLAALADLALLHPDSAACISTEQAYFLKRRSMICYAEFKRMNYPIGSGSGEAAHKVVVQERMKRAGMRWKPDNINPFCAIRNLLCNDRWATDWPAISRKRMRVPITDSVIPPSLLPVGFKLQPRIPWRNQPVGSARFRPSPEKS